MRNAAWLVGVLAVVGCAGEPATKDKEAGAVVVPAPAAPADLLAVSKWPKELWPLYTEGQARVKLQLLEHPDDPIEWLEPQLASLPRDGGGTQYVVIGKVRALNEAGLPITRRWEYSVVAEGGVRKPLSVQLGDRYLSLQHQ